MPRLVLCGSRCALVNLGCALQAHPAMAAASWSYFRSHASFGGVQKQESSIRTPSPPAAAP
jgi:hypothetical protein